MTLVIAQAGTAFATNDSQLNMILQSGTTNPEGVKRVVLSLPPLMIYAAAGMSGLTGLVGTFFIKEYLDLSATFLAALVFWSTIPWALKIPIGHLVDLLWRHKAGLVYLGAALITASLTIMIGLIGQPKAMDAILPASAWYVLSALLAPVGYVMQDAVADAMTVEAVPRLDDAGQPLDAATLRRLHTTMQMLGRVAIIGGGVLVSIANVVLFQGVEALAESAKVAIYLRLYELALIIPLLSVSGVALASLLKRREARCLAALGHDRHVIDRLLHEPEEATAPNPWILGGSTVFIALTIGIGLSGFRYGQEVIFAGSFAIIAFMMSKLLRELSPEAARTLLGTAIVIFTFRAMPGLGAGASWWMIDDLGFDEAFLSKLDLITSTLTLVGLFLFRRFMAEQSIIRIVMLLVLATTILALPNIGLFYGLHHWTAAHTSGIVDARFIALVNTALESPLGHVAMVPILAWVAKGAPAHLKATFFAVLTSFINIGLSGGQMATKYLNEVFVIQRGHYDALGGLMISAALIGLITPLGVMGLVRKFGLKVA